MKNMTLQDKLDAAFDNFNDKNALEYGNKNITYAELGKRANQIAARISEKSIEKEIFIGILVTDRIDCIIAVLGVLKARCVFVPLDTAHPKERLHIMLDSIHIQYVITDGSNLNRYPLPCFQDKPERLLLVEDLLMTGETVQIPDGDSMRYSPEDKIYVYFTSGTEGKPKALVGKNKSLLHYALWEIDHFNIDESFRICQFANIGFDAFLKELFVTILSGGTLCIPREMQEILSGDKLIHWLETHRINLVHCVPSLFRLLNSPRLTASHIPHLKFVLLSGDHVYPTELIDWYDKFDHRIQLANLYGTTETTILSTCYLIHCDDVNRDRIPIGKPIKGTRTIVLDDNMEVCSTGVVGEIYIRTPFRTFGYYNDDRLNKKRFIQNPFNDNPDDLIYKTGDSGRFLADGSIEVLGRLDRQVKIRGIRINLEEIENILIRHPSVKEAVVKKINLDNNELLTAYVCLHRQNREDTPEQDELAIAALKTYLSQQLPDYTLPAAIIKIDKVPLTSRGKMAYDLLPDPYVKMESNYLPPENPVEEKLIHIWSDVLKVEKIGIINNFFEIGGNSLKVVSLISKIQKEFAVKISVIDIFDHPTVEVQAKIIQASAKERFEEVQKAEKKEYYDLSSAQGRLYFIQELDPDSTAYHLPMVIPLTAGDDRQVERIMATFKKLIARHESFRTYFQIIGDKPVQRIHAPGSIEFTMDYYDISEVEADRKVEPGEKDHYIALSLQRSFIRPFDLSKAPLLRARLIKTYRERDLMLVDMHHIAADGTSLIILTEEFKTLYTGKTLPPLKLQYKDYSRWFNSKKQQESIKLQKDYWMKLFTGELPVLNLPIDYKRPPMQSFEGNQVEVVLDTRETKLLKEMTKQNDVTLYMYLLAVLTVLFSKLSGQEDIILGTPISARRHADLQQIIGMMVNTLPMRNYPSGDKTFKQFLKEVKQHTLQAYENQEYPFEELVDNLAVTPDTSRSPVFDVVFNLLNQAEYTGPIPGTREQKSYVHRKSTAKFDLSLTAVEAGQRLLFILEYCSQLFKPGTVERIIHYLKKIIFLLPTNEEQRLSGLEIITAEEKQQILFDFNDTGTGYPEDITIDEVFRQQVEKSPDRTALIETHKNRFLSYNHLNEKSGQLAGVLRERGIKPGAIVGIMIERSLWMLIGIIGIIKAGAAYLPIDPQDPPGRKKYLLKDSSARLLLTTGMYSRQIDRDMEIIEMENSKIARDKAGNPDALNIPDDLIYVIYTSGSTGSPKGVMVEHGPVVNILFTLSNRYPFSDTDVYLMKTSYLFDVSVTEIFGWIWGGGRLVLLEKEGEKDPEKILDTIKRECVTHINFVPSMFRAFLDFLDSPANDGLSGLKYIFLAGEALYRDMVSLFTAKNNNIRLENIYGPTEASIYVSKYSLGNGDWNGRDRIPIGKPLNNLALYVLDKQDHLQPIGIQGELCISGVGLARGYLNNPELTAQKFQISDKFGYHRSYIYKTGDLARWLPDGNIEFLGRIDQQVKLRGFRIEPGEIENRLLQHEEIKEAVVVDRAKGNGDRFLCAYIVTAPSFPRAIKTSKLKDFLSQTLPHYMIPAYFLPLNRIPLTASGKLDKKRLLEIAPGYEEKNAYEAPRNPLQQKLAEIWADVLTGREPLPGTPAKAKPAVGIDDNFFDLGGHSLKAIILAARIHRELNVKIPLAEIFNRPTIRKLAGHLKFAKLETYAAIEPAEKKEYYPSSSAQQRLYFIQYVQPESTVYNLFQALPLGKGTRLGKLEQAFKLLISRHESLRTSFFLLDDEPVQKVHDKVSFEIEHYDSTTSGFIRPFDLSGAPLLRVEVLKNNQQEHLLLIDMHHIITDGKSIEILTKELTALDAGEELPALKLQYKDYSQWWNSKKQRQLMKEQEAFWLNLFAHEPPVLNIPTDYPRPRKQTSAGKTVNFILNKKETEKIKSIALQNGGTAFMVILALMNVFFSKLCGEQGDIVMGTVTDGRRHADLHDIIGMFVNTLALRNYPGAHHTFREFMKDVIKKTLQAFENQDYPFETLVENILKKRETNRNPLLDVLLVYQKLHPQKLPAPAVKNTRPKSKPQINNKFENPVTKFDLTIFANEGKENFSVSIQYRTALFKEKTIKRFVTYFKEIVTTTLTNIDIPLKDIQVSHGLGTANLNMPETGFGF